MKTKTSLLVTCSFVLFLCSPATATSISWTDWTTATSGQVSGALTVNSNTINVTFSGAYIGAQTSGGINYWNPSAPYMIPTASGYPLDNAPSSSDIIMLSAGGTATISFSQAVLDPFFALVSWNGNTANFNTPIVVIDNDRGYFGSGTPILNVAGTGFSGSGEVHGVIRLPGTFTSITFSHTSENWHGFTVGVAGVPTQPVPEPTTMLLFASGLLGLVGLARRRKS